MSTQPTRDASVFEEIFLSFIFSFIVYIFASISLYPLANYFMGETFSINANILWNIVFANLVVAVVILLFIPAKVKWKLFALVIFFSLNFYLDTYKQSTINYYLSYGSYMNPDIYPENSNQRKMITDIMAHKDMDYMGDYDTSYFMKADIDKLGNMTTFFMMYGNRNEQMKTYSVKFKELLKSPYLTSWDYLKFENEVIDYLRSSENALQGSESVVMLNTIKFGV